MRDINIGLEMEFIFNSKKYTLSRSNKKYFFSAVEEVYACYNSYEERVESINIGYFSITGIVKQQLYEDWYIY